ncbi:MAG: hypothetical protein ACR5K9_09470, partial [Wolbachia sp.]
SIFLFEPTPFHLNLLDTFSSFFTSYSIFIYYLFLGLWTTSKMTRGGATGMTEERYWDDTRKLPANCNVRTAVCMTLA